MILGRSSFLSWVRAWIEVSPKDSPKDKKDFALPNTVFVSLNKTKNPTTLISENKNLIVDQNIEIIKNTHYSENNKEYNFKFVTDGLLISKTHVDINLISSDLLDIEKLKETRKDVVNAIFIKEDNGDFICDSEVEKMSKSKYNVQTPDELVEKFGADTLRCYEMFLGPLEQAKPWDTNGISGVNGFLKKLWRLFHQGETFTVTEGEADKKSLKTLHTAIKKITEDLERYSFNTIVSNLMICVNELQAQKCNNKQILSDLLVLASPYAPHICEELWNKLGNTESITFATWPKFNPEFLVEANHNYPVSFNGKMRFMMELPTNMGKEDIEKAVMAHEKTGGYLDGKAPKKVIIVPKKIVNIVI